MKKLLVSILISVALLTGCASMKTLDYSNVVVHEALIETREYPQMVMPADFQIWLDAIEEDMDIIKVGAIVDNNGDVCIFFEHKTTGACSAVIVLLSQGGSVHPIGCEDAWLMYEELCVTKGFCSENPHIDGEA